jgi:hypothetical protein
MRVHGSGGRLCHLANCAICLLGLDHSSLAVPRSFRVYSGSWKLPRDRSYRAGDGPRPVRAGSGLALGF